MNIEATKLEILQHVMKIDNEALLLQLKDFLNINPNEEDTSFVTKEQREEIQQGINDFEKGDFTQFNTYLSSKK